MKKSLMRHYLKPAMLASVLSINSSNMVFADTNNQHQVSENTSVMETITIVYKNAFDYALYRHTTEMLTTFRLQLQSDIMVDARQQSKTMACDFGISVAISAPLLETPIPLDSTRVLAAPH
ncbi:hypothetical protein ACFOD0_05535 [Shewanella intestini]|uniref:Uncharacterized protein n=1 Tax=Shewanella intestini TaxID=2017544 RepID=A0ABS5I6K6_9GAMM|nr:MULTISPECIES: hypothetical protein [Shewanella]MBR9729453.1 hypothetical protein [Shewanella intestini]MRG35086.1 hypothetical protein [Shewanella sp. XMDDZSB0408]